MGQRGRVSFSTVAHQVRLRGVVYREDATPGLDMGQQERGLTRGIGLASSSCSGQERTLAIAVHKT